ncbi:fimbrillin family protein [uncultured Bacteroides sp.]|uniref:fimbrillin family protein n=1 Tax=uncultured Bacteroides sp. TaxID=162156 RepID=UPI0025F15007|nr:fimbrillin family protein [uncultured Bacteroides sp.]
MKGIKLSTFAARCALFTTCCALFAACSQTDETELPAVPIGFVPTVETQTRGTDFTKDNLTSLGVLAYLTQGSSFNASSSTPNFMYNQEVTKASGAATWEYAPTKFWPANSNDKITFFAYAPHNPTGLTVPDITATGYPSFTYAVPSTEAAQTDLLLAKPAPNKTASDGKVNFSFKHALTRIVLNVEAGSGFTGITINSLSIKTKKSGTVAFSSTTSATDWMQWSNIASGAGNDISCTATLPSSSSTVSAGSTGKIATFFLLPVAATGNTSENATLTFSYTMNGIGDTKTITDLALTSMADWLPATSITYNLKITRTAATVEVGSISVWYGTTADIDKSGEIAEGYKAGDIKTGDFYYDDGTWSDGGYRMLTDGNVMQYNVQPTEGKNCIGIVYANAKTGTERGDNISIYSSTGLSGATEIKGYVVALDRISGVRRSGSGSNNTTAFNGYTNTQNLSTSSSNPREIREVLINTTTPPPSSTSGWYVMSLGQTMYAYENRDIIDKSRTNISSGSYENMDFGNVWTSSYKTTGSNFPTIFNNGSYGNAQPTSMQNAYPGFTF